MTFNIDTEKEQILRILESVPDPEVPVLSVNDLGIVRSINIISERNAVEIHLTPTYSGCPAMDAISMSIRLALQSNGYRDVKIIKVLSPAWTTEWISEIGKQKLKAYGIAPPGPLKEKFAHELFSKPGIVQCPLCNSLNTAMVSEFGSTSCKSLFRCNDCHEPFDHFKCH